MLWPFSRKQDERLLAVRVGSHELQCEDAFSVLSWSMNDCCCVGAERICSIICWTSPTPIFVLFYSESMAKIKPHICSNDCLDPSPSTTPFVSIRVSRLLTNVHVT